ncbi:hypothetical protein ACFL5Z_09505 [Planctomycetota bacterium]
MKKTTNTNAIKTVKKPKKKATEKKVAKSKEVVRDKAQRRTEFKPLSSEELAEILGLTIKKDEANKLITFLCMLSAYTEDSQINIGNIAPSSSGKSYIPGELAPLFPDVVQLGYCSPKAFFHDAGQYDKELMGYRINLERKILIFLDQPHTLLLEHLRPMLSHDKKEITVKIADKNARHGHSTKTNLLIGYPAVIFCSTGLKLDEQEKTRLILLSPDINQEKLRYGVIEKIKKESNTGVYQQRLDENPERRLLQERIRAIRDAHISEINIAQPEIVERRFLAKHKVLKPRHQRDVAHLLSLVKAFALLNLWHRDRIGSTIVANRQDIREAFKLWDAISESQELGLPPYIYEFYQQVIAPAFFGKSVKKCGEKGLTRREIMKKHYEVYKQPVADWVLRQDILPALEITGLIRQEPAKSDKRKMLIYPYSPTDKG